MREGGEEIGGPLLSCEKIGQIVAGNTTFICGYTPIFLARVDEDRLGKQNPDEKEKIYKVDFFTQEEIDEMIGADEIVCPLSIAAIKKVQVILAHA